MIPFTRVDLWEVDAMHPVTCGNGYGNGTGNGNCDGNATHPLFDL